MKHWGVIASGVGLVLALGGLAVTAGEQKQKIVDLERRQERFEQQAQRDRQELKKDIGDVKTDVREVDKKLDRLIELQLRRPPR